MPLTGEKRHIYIKQVECEGCLLQVRMETGEQVHEQEKCTGPPDDNEDRQNIKSSVSEW